MYTIVELINKFLYDIQMILMLIGVIVGMAVIWTMIKEYREKNIEKSYVPILATDIGVCILMIIIGTILSAEVDKENVLIKMTDILFYQAISIMFILLIGNTIFNVWRYRQNTKKTIFDIIINNINIGLYVLSGTIILSTRYGETYILRAFCAYIVVSMIKFLLIEWGDIETYGDKVSELKKKENVLYGSRVAQLDAVWANISRPVKKAKCIAINGEWGLGKTHFIEALIGRLEENNHKSIYISSLILTDTINLITLFQEELIKLFEENNLYTGMNSGINEYFKYIFKLVKVDDKLNTNLLKKQKANYHERREHLQTQLNYLLQRNNDNEISKNLIIVIDDFDRLEDTKRLEIFNFINQIFNLDGIVIVLGLDFNNMIERNKVNKGYTEKFIDEVFYLSRPHMDEVLDFHKKEVIEPSIMCEYIKKVMNDVYRKNNINDKINELINLEIFNLEKIYKGITFQTRDTEEDKLRKENQKNQLKKDLKCLKKASIKVSKETRNPRKIQHFIDQLNINLIYVEKLFEKCITQKGIEEIQNIFNSVYIDEIIIMISYLSVFYKETFSDILSFGGIEEYLNEGNDEKGEKKIVEALVKHGLCRGSYNDYLMQEPQRIYVTNVLMVIKGLIINQEYLIKGVEFRTEKDLLVKRINDTERIHVLKDNYMQIYETLKYDQEKKYVNALKIFNNYIMEEVFINKTMKYEVLLNILGQFSRIPSNTEVVLDLIEVWQTKIDRNVLTTDLVKRNKRMLEGMLDSISFKAWLKIQQILPYLSKRYPEIKNIDNKEVLTAYEFIKQLQVINLIEEKECRFRDIYKNIDKRIVLGETINNEMKSLRIAKKRIQNLIKLGCEAEQFIEQLKETRPKEINYTDIYSKEQAQEYIEYFLAKSNISEEDIFNFYRTVYWINKEKDMQPTIIDNQVVDNLKKIYGKIQIQPHGLIDHEEDVPYLNLTILIEELERIVLERENSENLKEDERC